ncbi:hypothetical protein RFI_07247 [Reticulomyxa filosa]|uniref:Phosphoribulokinase/uridine kinase domain-containing protein n=1 Tax=Reticulomyxa filosa TaxID=46433 RepID=X6NVP7_RETFI|nr:hypothetical protein RFI_07247 [Reticulomyxa filosa]|eukprot:ETO29874.1 hypothetical protein RFI_07247 [Reticulomyxa filosa]
MSKSDSKENVDISSSKSTVIVIGISGATRSGKGTLARNLVTYIGEEHCLCICQDKFFDVEKIYAKLDGNWEIPEALKPEEFLKQISKMIDSQKAKKSGKKYVIIEGFLAFTDSRICNLLDVMFWLDINKEVCYQRRMTTKRVPHDYFEQYLWPGHLQYKSNVFENAQLKQRIVHIDGTLHASKILDMALDTLQLRTPTENGCTCVTT